MSGRDEPEDGSYVAVQPFGADGFSTRVYLRRDDWAELNGLGLARWFSRTDPEEPARTWEWVAGSGDLAYVGAFVDRSDYRKHLKEAPWPSE